MPLVLVRECRWISREATRTAGTISSVKKTERMANPLAARVCVVELR